MTRRELFVHIGASKTGTSALQKGLFASHKELLTAGVGVPLVGRPAHVKKVLRPLGWVTAQGFVKRLDTARLERLGALLAEAPGDRVLLSNEDLCEAEPAHIEAFRTVVDEAGFDLRIVLTLRDLASVLPSEWQQMLRHRVTTPYPQFLDDVRDRQGPVARHFWQRQDAAAICRRWAAVSGPENLDIIVVPRFSEDPDGLFRMFADVVGYPPEVVRLPEADVNASLGYVEAEVYRRLNAALGDRLSDYERQYQPAVRHVLVYGVLERGASGRITVPPEHIPWIREEATRQLRDLEGGGYRLHGNACALVPARDAGRDLPPLPEEEIAQAAVTTLANFAVFTFNRRQRAEGAKAGGGKPRRRPGSRLPGLRRR